MFKSRFGVAATILAIAVAVTILAAGTAEAQQRKGKGFGGRGGRGGGFELNMVMLAANPGVQEELKVTDEQRETIEKVAAAYGEDVRELRSGLRDLSEEEAAKKQAEVAEKQKPLTADAEKKILAALKEDQVKRLKEITLQNTSPRALLRSDIADALKLTDEQKTKLKDLFAAQEQMRNSAGAGKGEKADKGDKGEKGEKGEKGGKRERRGLGGGGGGGRFAQMRQQAEEDAKKILTEEQQKQYEAMKGAKYELQMQFGGRNRGEKGGDKGGEKSEK